MARKNEQPSDKDVEQAMETLRKAGHAVPLGMGTVGPGRPIRAKQAAKGTATLAMSKEELMYEVENASKPQQLDELWDELEGAGRYSKGGALHKAIQERKAALKNK